MDIVDSNSIPICPHCEAELTTIEKVTHGIMTMHFVYLCPHCKKVLGITVNG